MAEKGAKRFLSEIKSDKPQPVFEVRVQVFEGIDHPVVVHPVFPPGKEHQGAAGIVDMLLEAAQMMIRERLLKDPSRIVRV